MFERTELDDLRERLAKLPFGQQLYLFELLLGDYRLRCERERAAIRAQNLAAEAELREWEQRQAEARRAAG